MAIYHLNIKPIARSKGHSASSAISYETGQKLIAIDGTETDFTRKSGVERWAVLGVEKDPQKLADKMELAENRRNSTVGKRFTIALPNELNKEQRWRAAEEYGKWLQSEYKTAVVVSMHAPDRGGDQRNNHAHITMADRVQEADGSFGAKLRELTSREKMEGTKTTKAKFHLNKMREKWEQVANIELEMSGNGGIEISHKSYKDQGKDKLPTCHLGREKTEMLRKERFSYAVHPNEHNKIIKKLNERTKSNTQALPAEESYRDHTRGSSGSTRNAPEARKPVKATESTVEPNTAILGSREWKAERDAKKRASRESRFRKPLTELSGMLGEIRDQIREIREKISKSIDRGNGRKLNKNKESNER